MRLAPRSLSGQLALVITLALLLASAMNAALLVSERSRAGLIETTAPVVARFADQVARVQAGADLREVRDARVRPLDGHGGDHGGAPPGASRNASARGDDREGPRGRTGPARVRLEALSNVERRGLRRSERLEARLRHALDQDDSGVTEVRAATRIVRSPGRGAGMRDAETDTRAMFRNGAREVLLSAQLADGRWLNFNTLAPLPPQLDAWRQIAPTLVLFVAVLGGALWVARRISRPLAGLAASAHRVGSAGGAPELKPEGPSDVRQTIEAFNAMNRRVSDLLTEKNVMLGALGHDLRTPLTSLRLRVETMEPAADRERAIAIIEETTALLNSILDLARLGGSREAVERIDLGELARAVTAEFAEQGRPVRRPADGAPVHVDAQPTLVRQALRNLIDNALKYGGGAAVSVSANGGRVRLAVEDEGPGMSAELIEQVRRPFVRGETSRNRTTGGAGLGLALADTIARTQGGELVLANRTPRGLRAEIVLPDAGG
jgi:signal transduction histidine kinase